MELRVKQISQPLLLREKLELVIGDGNNSGCYSSRIEDFTDEGIVISLPVFVSGKTLLRENSLVRVLITKEDAVYQFYCNIHKVKIRGLDGYLLQDISEIQRVQRRKYVRVDIAQEILISKIPEFLKNGKSTSPYLEWKTSFTVNLSGGGALIKTKTFIDNGDIALLNIDLFNHLALPKIIAGVCRRVVNKKDFYYCGLEFIVKDTINDYFPKHILKCLPPSVRKFDLQEQNILSNYVFQLQIKMRQKGLL